MLLDDIKLALRRTNDVFDSEINDLIEQAKADIKLAGVPESKIVDTDPLIKRAIIVYCKANFGLNNPDSEKYQKSYEAIRDHLALSIDYAVAPEV